MYRFIFISFFIFTSCDLDDLRHNELLDLENPRAVTNLKDFTIEVFDKVERKKVDLRGDYLQETDFFQIYVETKLNNPPESYIFYDGQNSFGKDRQSQYRINLISRNYVHIDNFDSLFIDTELEIKNVSVTNRNIILNEQNEHSKYLTYANQNIATIIICEIVGTGERFLIQYSNRFYDGNLRKIRELGLPFKLHIELHLISGENIRVPIREPGGRPTGAFINPNNHVRYRLNFAIRGYY